MVRPDPGHDPKLVLTVKKVNFSLELALNNYYSTKIIRVIIYLFVDASIELFGTQTTLFALQNYFYA